MKLGVIILKTPNPKFPKLFYRKIFFDLGSPQKEGSCFLEEKLPQIFFQKPSRRYLSPLFWQGDGGYISAKIGGGGITANL
jgi:hypothetical protein